MLLALPQSACGVCDGRMGLRLEKVWREWDLRDLPGWFGSCSLGEVALQVYGSKLGILSHEMQMFVLGVGSLTSTECSWCLSLQLPELCNLLS